MSIVKKSFSVFTISWIQIPLGILANIIVIRELGAEGRGIYVFLVSLATILATLGTFGLSTSAIYFLKKKIITYKEIHFYFLITTSLFFLLIFIFFKFYFIDITSQFSQDSSQIDFGLIYIFLIMLSSMYLAFNQSITLGLGYTKIYGAVISINSVSFLLSVVILLILSEQKIIGALLALCISQIISVLISLFLILNKKKKENFEFSFQSMYEFIYYGLRRYPSSLFPLFLTQLPNIYIGTFLGYKSLGFYSVAQTAFNGLNSIPRAINVLLFGTASALKINEAIKLVMQASRVQASLVFILWIILSVLSIFFIPLIFGEEFVRSILPTVILSFSVTFVAINVSTESYFLSQNRPGFVSSVNLITAIITTILSPILVYFFNIEGMALAIVIARLCSCTIFTYNFQKISKLPSTQQVFILKSDIENILASIKKKL